LTRITPEAQALAREITQHVVAALVTGTKVDEGEVVYAVHLAFTRERNRAFDEAAQECLRTLLKAPAKRTPHAIAVKIRSLKTKVTP
jgi:hypothetical protein